MLDTISPSMSGAVAARPAPKRMLGDISARLAGAGAIAFVATVITQNVVRGGSAPTNGAPTDEVLAHYVDHRSITYALVAMFLFSGVGLAVFLGGAMRRLLATDRRGWALTGFVGAIAVIALFAVVVGAEQALSIVANGDQPAAGAIDALWALHNSVFTMLYLPLAMALLGLSRAGIAAGITPTAFQRLAPAGSALLLVAAVGGPSIAGGGAMPLFAVGGVGFLIWLAFLLTTGIRLVRSESLS